MAPWPQGKIWEWTPESVYSFPGSLGERAPGTDLGRNGPSMSAANIVFVDDDRTMHPVVGSVLEKSGYRVSIHETLEAAWTEIQAALPDLVVLDRDLPDGDGLELLRRIREDERTQRLPILLLTHLSDEEQRVAGLEEGADDYISKPVSYRELALRVRAVLARTQGFRPEEPAERIREFGEVQLDLDRMQALVGGKDIGLTTTEFSLLEYLTRFAARVVSRSKLLEEVWGTSGTLTTRRVDTYVQRLRNKMGDAGRFIHTHRGNGYRFEVPPARPESHP